MFLRPAKSFVQVKSVLKNGRKSNTNLKRKYAVKKGAAVWEEPKIIETLRSLRDEPTEFEEFIEQFVPVNGDDAFTVASQIYIIAVHAGLLDQVEKDLVALYNSEDKGDLLFAFNGCFFDTDETSALFRNPAYIQKLGIHPVTSYILGYLSESGVDVELIFWAITDYLDLLKRARKEVDMTLYVPKGTDTQYQNFLINFIKNEHNLNESQVQLSVEVDPNLFGGYRVIIDQILHDRSHNSGFTQATERLKPAEAKKYLYEPPKSTLYEEAVRLLELSMKD